MVDSSASSNIKIGQGAEGIIGQTVIGATVIYGSVIYNNPPKVPDSSTNTTKTTEIGPDPYKGLLAFQETDGDRFFGRDSQIKELWEKFRDLHESDSAIRVLTIYGPSGSGKSSLARAGLIPELARRPLPGRDRARIAVLVPGDHPLEALATVLARIATNDPTPVTKTREFATELFQANASGNYDGLRRIANALPEIAVSPLIVLVDQLEEIFTLREDPGERDAFISNLLCAAAERSKRVSVIFTLRSDFLGATQKHPRLNQLIEPQGFFVAAMSEDGLREAITKPAELAGHPLDQATVNLLIEQTEGREGALPLLQFALTRIWAGLTDGKEPAETLRVIGGVGGALAGEAQRIYKGLSPNEQEIARRIFLGLVQLGEGTKDTRRRIKVSELVASQDDPQRIRQVINRFCDPGARLVTVASLGNVEETVEVTHEALFENWKSLKEWLGNQRDALSEKRKIEATAQKWQEQKEKGSKQKDYLLQGQPLKDAERYQKEKTEDLPLSLIASEFVEQSQKKRRNSRLQFFWLFLIPLIILTVVGGFTLQKEIQISQLILRVDAAKGKKEINDGRAALQELVTLHQPLNNFDLSGANLNSIDLSNANLDGANLSGANLSNANLSYTTLTYAILSNADLTEATLQYTVLNEANLHKANLHNAKLYRASLHNAKLSNADLSNADLSNADLSNADFSNADLSNADLSNAYLTGANLSGANLYKAKLYKTELDIAKLSNADLTGANLTGANLTGANLSGANLSKANLSYTTLPYANLSGANLYKTKLYKAKLYESLSGGEKIAVDEKILTVKKIKAAKNWTEANYDPEFRKELGLSPKNQE